MNTSDPVALAREVLDAVKVMDDAPGTLYLDGPTHECDKAASSILDAAPDLARAVLRMEALADELKKEGRRVSQATQRTPRVAGWASGVASASTRIRNALNGENQ